MAAIPWDDDRDARLLRLRAAGITFEYCALLLHTTRNACLGRYDRLNKKAKNDEQHSKAG